jgi:hypothetical protein
MITRGKAVASPHMGEVVGYRYFYSNSVLGHAQPTPGV